MAALHAAGRADRAPAQLALQLYNDEGTIGGLNLYSTRSPTVEPDAVRVAELFASHAAIALGRARREEQLNDALVMRKVIGQAIGLTMEHYQITEDRAFLFLVRASQTSNVKPATSRRTWWTWPTSASRRGTDASRDEISQAPFPPD